MLEIKTISNDELIKYLTKTNGKLADNEYLICITGSTDNLIVLTKSNMLSVIFDNELYGPRVLSFDDGISIFKFTKKLIDLCINNNIKLLISCKDGGTLSGSIAQWISEYIDSSLLDTKYFNEKNLFIEPSTITLNKMYLVQYFYTEGLLQQNSLANIAANIIESSNMSKELKAISEEYLKLIFLTEMRGLK